MQTNRLWLVVAIPLGLLCALWLLSVPDGTLTGDFWSWRKALIYLTGVLAMGSMSLGVMLAARPVQIESALGGLDKFYRLHKWFGVTGLTLALTHWLLEVGPRWLGQLGWLTRPARPPQTAVVATGFDPFRDLKDIATELGELSLYLLIVLVLLALWKRFPYRAFLTTHRLMAPIYLVLVFHAVILVDRTYWSAPLGPVLALLMAGGGFAAVVALFRRIGNARKAVGRIESILRYDDNAVLDVGVRLETAWTGHRAGQFAFVDFGGTEGAHPFTVSSAWQRDGRLLFSIKGLGDYTRKLPDQLFVGQSVTIEGPYGRFDFEGDRARQVWVGGGVGITPFIARLAALAADSRENEVDLIYCTGAPSGIFIDKISALAAQAGVGFHLLVSPRDGKLTLDRLEAWIPAWKDADVWFCGPSGFGDAIRTSMIHRGLSASQFHQELFEMR
ncbi:MAG TPA: ferric reductase-like transmembrane domain-containing protein [Tardiphaga sp.]